jgi:hypothetical protein
MLLFDRPFSDIGVTFPATNLLILSAICNKCGVVLSTAQFINSNYTVITALDGNASCRDVIEYIAEMAASFARITRYGQLELAWFNNPQYITEAHVFSGTFAKNAAGKYYDGDNISGGDFQKYNNKMYFGGVFKSNAPVVSLNPSNRYDFSIDDDPIIITGVEFDAQDQNYLVGSDTYAIKITDNPFIQGDPTDVLNAIADRLIGFAYLPYTSNWQGNPALDAGDMIEQTDRNGITYRTIITNSSYAYRGTCKIQAKGASVVTQGYQSPMTKKVTQLLRQISQKQVQLDSLQQAILNATNLIASALGGYSIQGTGQYEGNSFIADNPDVTLAAKVWRWNLGGFGYSSSGVNGPFTTAITADGSIVANLLTAQIITGAMIKGGTITGDKISAGTITTALLAAGAITGDKISAGAITTALLAAGAITGDKISAGAITTANLAAGTITGDKIAVGSITGNNIQAGSITADQINTNNLVTSKISDGGTVSGLIGRDSSGWGGLILYNTGSMVLTLVPVNSGSTGSLIRDNIFGNIISFTSYGIGISGNFSVSGQKNCIQETKDYGKRLFSSFEMTDIRLGDCGRGTVQGGTCQIDIDPIFAECVNLDMDYDVYLTKYGKGNVWVDKMVSDHFTVEGDDINFAWELKAKRRGFEDKRLELFENNN